LFIGGLRNCPPDGFHRASLAMGCSSTSIWLRILLAANTTISARGRQRQSVVPDVAQRVTFILLVVTRSGTR
jgi:hypothetical protein